MLCPPFLNLRTAHSTPLGLVTILDAYSVVDLPTFSLSWRNLICSLVVWGFFHPLHTQGRLAELLNWFVKGHQYSLEPLDKRIFA